MLRVIDARVAVSPLCASSDSVVAVRGYWVQPMANDVFTTEAKRTQSTHRDGWKLERECSDDNRHGAGRFVPPHVIDLKCVFIELNAFPRHLSSIFILVAALRLIRIRAG